MGDYVNMSDYLAIADTYHDFTGSRCKIINVKDNLNTDFNDISSI